MRLFIAEKPSLGRAIAQFLPGENVSKGTHIIAGDDVVTWCFGHLLETAEPEYYSDEYKKWSFESLPMIPDNWVLLEKKESKDQVKVIKGLLKQASEVVNAGDPDREGQLLVDELLEHLGNTKPVKRIWLASLDETSVKKAISTMKDNSEYQNLKNSALARSRGDWLVGMNLTRAYTLAGQNSGYSGVLSIGRVQTPTLSLVVKRDLEIENFKPKDFFAITAEINQMFNARWKPSDNVSVDDAGRLLDKSIADSIVSKIQGKSGTVTKYEAVEKKQTAPLPFSLSALQQTANKKFGLSAQQVLDIAQELYEAKLTTYPRTDCQYLPESQFNEAGTVISGLTSKYPELTASADKSIKSSVWNDKKITAHHAIIPTGQIASLSGDAEKLYDLIVRSYLAQFYPPFIYKQTNIILNIENETFIVSGKTPLSQGWKVVFGATEEDEDDNEKEDKQTLPELHEGGVVKCSKALVHSKKTTPPSRYTEGSLIAAMTNIHQLVDDPELKKRLKETAGIGTEATRAGILETLKKRGFIANKQKQLISTDAARKLIAALPEQVKSPGLTGLFEQALEGIAVGQVRLEQFIAKQIEFVNKYVELAKTSTIAVAASFPCPACKQGHLRKLKNDKGHFWGCSRFAEGCKTSFPDKAGKPSFSPTKGPAKKKK